MIVIGDEFVLSSRDYVGSKLAWHVTWTQRPNKFANFVGPADPKIAYNKAWRLRIFLPWKRVK